MKQIQGILFVLMLIVSCTKDGFWDAGPETSRTVVLQEFSTLKLSSIFDVILIQDSDNYAVITCGKYAIDKVELINDNGTLELKQSTDVNWTRTYKHTQIELHYNNISNIYIKSCVKIVAEKPMVSPSLKILDLGELSEVELNINCDNFSLAVGTDNIGVYKISGTANNTSFNLNGSAHFLAANLVSENSKILHNGIGDCIVNAKKSLTGEILKNGVVKYYNYPNLVISVDNKRGKLLQINK